MKRIGRLAAKWAKEAAISYCQVRGGCYVPLHRAPVAQLDRVPDYESGGRRFESFLARQKRDCLQIGAVPFLVLTR